MDAIDLAQFGIEGPSTVPCISVLEHIAQKIHAVSRPNTEHWVNDRFRDVVDLLLLRDWVTNMDRLREICQQVFSSRGMHSWPPDLVVHDHWVDPYARLAGEVGLETIDLFDALIELGRFILEIDPTYTARRYP